MGYSPYQPPATGTPGIPFRRLLVARVVHLIFTLFLSTTIALCPLCFAGLPMCPERTLKRARVTHAADLDDEPRIGGLCAFRCTLVDVALHNCIVKDCKELVHHLCNPHVEDLEHRCVCPTHTSSELAKLRAGRRQTLNVDMYLHVNYPRGTLLAAFVADFFAEADGCIGSCQRCLFSPVFTGIWRCYQLFF
jgi:hypothetical protein